MPPLLRKEGSFFLGPAVAGLFKLLTGLNLFRYDLPHFDLTAKRDGCEVSIELFAVCAAWGRLGFASLIAEIAALGVSDFDMDPRYAGSHEVSKDGIFSGSYRSKPFPFGK